MLRRLFLALTLALGLSVTARPVAAAVIWYVAPTGQDSADCTSPASPCGTIQGAIAKASADDILWVAQGVYTGTGAAVVQSSIPLTLRGGWDPTFTIQSGLSVVDGELERQALNLQCNVFPNAPVTIERFEVTRGFGLWAGGISILCPTTLLQQVYVHDNVAGSPGSGSGNPVGSGIDSHGVLTILDSTISSNRTVGMYQDNAILTNNTLTLMNTTVDGNAGIGVAAVFAAAVNIFSSTITRNGVGVYVQGTPAFRIQDSIVAESNGNDCFPDFNYGGQFVSLGHNLFGTRHAGCPITGTDLRGNQAGLSDLAAWGGATPTRAVRSDSPVLNAGTPTGCRGTTEHGSSTDQRGAGRTGRCDIGAYEAQFLATLSQAGRTEPGQVLTYTLQLAAVADGSEPGAMTASDTLPAALSVVPGSASASTGAVQVNGQIVSWSGVVSAASPATVSFAATLGADTRNQEVVNTVLAAAQGYSGPSSAVSTGPIGALRLPALTRHACQDFTDAFSNPASGWPVSDTAQRRLEYLNGQYRILAKQPGYLYLVRAPTCPRAAPYWVQGDLSWVGQAGSDLGLIFGDTGAWDVFYLLDINTDDDAYGVYRFNADGSVTTLLGMTKSASLATGTAPIPVTVVRGAQQITVWLNHTLAVTLNEVGPELSFVGVAAAPYDGQSNADARFDNFSVHSGSLVEGAADWTAAGSVGAPSDWQPRLTELERVWP